jgi:hypothetical protein
MLSINGREISLRAYCSQFNFRSGDQQACAAAACCDAAVQCFLATPGLRSDQQGAEEHTHCCVCAEEGGRALWWRAQPVTACQGVVARLLRVHDAHLSGGRLCATSWKADA